MSSLFESTAAAAANAMEGAAIGRAIGKANDAADQAEFEAQQLSNYASQLENELARNGIKQLQRPNLVRPSNKIVLTEKDVGSLFKLAIWIAAILLTIAGFFGLQSAIKNHRLENLKTELNGIWRGDVTCIGTGKRNLTVVLMVAPRVDSWGNTIDGAETVVSGWFDFYPKLPKDNGRVGLDNHHTVAFDRNGSFNFPREPGTTKYAMSGKFDVKAGSLAATVEGCTMLNAPKKS